MARCRSCIFAFPAAFLATALHLSHSALLAAGGPQASREGPEYAFSQILSARGWLEFSTVWSQKGGSCPDSPISATKDCLEKQGFKLDIFSGAPCELTIQEEYPLWGESRTSDGKLQETYIIGRLLTFSFSGLASVHFEDNVTVLFDFSKQLAPIRKVLTTASEGKWLDLPPPPTMAAVSSLFVDQQRKKEQYGRLFQEWQQKIISLGRRGGNQSDFLDEFKLRGDDNTGHTIMGITLDNSPKLDDALRSIIAKCKK
jgi:hypothetical protein